MYTKEDSRLACFGAGIVVGMGILTIILAATKFSPVEMDWQDAFEIEQSKQYLESWEIGQMLGGN
jgi:hypothetical protein